MRSGAELATRTKTLNQSVACYPFIAPALSTLALILWGGVCAVPSVDSDGTCAVPVMWKARWVWVSNTGRLRSKMGLGSWKRVVNTRWRGWPKKRRADVV